MSKNPLPGRLLLDVFKALPSQGGLTTSQIVRFYSDRYGVPMRRATAVVHRAIKSALRSGFMYKTNRRLKLGLQENKRSRSRTRVEGSHNLYDSEHYFVIPELFDATEVQKKEEEKGGTAPKDGPGVGGGGLFPSVRGGGGGTCIPGDPDTHGPNCPHKHNHPNNKTDDNDNDEDDDDKNDDTTPNKSDQDSEDTNSSNQHKKRRTKRSTSDPDESSRRKVRRRRLVQHIARRVRRRTRR